MSDHDVILISIGMVSGAVCAAIGFFISTYVNRNKHNEVKISGKTFWANFKHLPPPPAPKNKITKKEQTF